MAISILYEIRKCESMEEIRNSALADSIAYVVGKARKKAVEEISMRLCCGNEITEKLAADPNYDFVILHIGNHVGGGAYTKARECRRLTRAILVGESALYPEGKDEALEYCDHYTDLIFAYDNFERLLGKYGLIK